MHPEVRTQAARLSPHAPLLPGDLHTDQQWIPPAQLPTVGKGGGRFWHIPTPPPLLHPARTIYEIITAVDNHGQPPSPRLAPNESSLTPQSRTKQSIPLDPNFSQTHHPATLRDQPRQDTTQHGMAESPLPTHHDRRPDWLPTPPSPLGHQGRRTAPTATTHPYSSKGSCQPAIPSVLTAAVPTPTTTS